MFEFEAKLLGLVVLGLLLSFFWFQVMQRQSLVTGPVVFVLYQLPNVATVVMTADYEVNFDAKWVAYVLLGFASFIIGGSVASTLEHYSAKSETAAMRKRPLVDDLANPAGVFFLVVSIAAAVLAGTLFAESVGYSTLGAGLSQFLAAGAVDSSAISELRRGATQETYAAAGYALQFVAALLPALIIAIYVRGVGRGRIAWKGCAVLLVPVNVYFLSILGGRQYLFGAALTVALLLIAKTSPLPATIGKRGLSSLVLMAMALALFGVTTVLQGRSEASGPGALAVQSVSSIFNRIGGDATTYQFTAIRILQEEAPVQGQHWLGQLSIVLPGRAEGVSFDERLHGLVFAGNTGGNQPLDVWGATYYNWGVVGMVLVPFVFGYLLQLFTIRKIVRGHRRVLGTVVLSAAGYNLALASDPYSLILQGGLTLLLYEWLFRSASPAPGARAPRAEAAGPPDAKAKSFPAEGSFIA